MSKNHLIKQLREHMIADLEAAIGGQEEEILRAITRAAEARTDSEEPLKFSVSLRGVLNLDKDEVETAFSFSTRTAVKAKHRLEDPNQEKLALDGVSVSIRTTGPDGEFSEPVTAPFAHVHRTIEGALAKGGYQQGQDGVYRKGETPAPLNGLDAYEAECERVFATREADGMFDTRAYKSRKTEGEV